MNRWNRPNEGYINEKGERKWRALVSSIETVEQGQNETRNDRIGTLAKEIRNERDRDRNDPSRAPTLQIIRRNEEAVKNRDGNDSKTVNERWREREIKMK